MPTTALVMIVRNEARCITRCLRSVRPWVDAMFVLDTGSTDATVALAQAEGAQVFHFTWVDDFSAARNAALAHSNADWNLVLDADEALHSGGEALRALQHTPPSFVGRIEVLSHTESGGVRQASPSWISRVLPRGARFEGRIHEQVVCALPARDLPIVALHDGYLPAQMAAKGDRNRRLLEAAVHTAPANAYLHYQLGKDHEVHDRFGPASAAYAKAWALLGERSARAPAWRHDLVLRRLFTLKALGQIDEAIMLAEAEMQNWPDSPDFYFVLGDVLLAQALAQPDQAPGLLPMIEATWQECLRIGENPRLEGAVAGRGSHLAQHNLRLLGAALAA